MSKYELPESGMDAGLACQLIHDELLLDGSARLNRATFVTTWMEPQAEKLMAECFPENMIMGSNVRLVYPGVGWVVWRSHEDLPEELVFQVDYLGGDMPTFTLDFSRAGNQVVGQYYDFLRLGRAGYTQVMEMLRDIACWLSGEIAKLGPFELLSDGSAIPVFAFKLREGQRHSVFDLSERLRLEGWQVPEAFAH